MAPLKTETEALRVDDALLAGTQIGPVIDQSQLDQDLDWIRIAQHEGVTLSMGGTKGFRYGSPEQGSYAAKFYLTVKSVYVFP